MTHPGSRVVGTHGTCHDTQRVPTVTNSSVAEIAQRLTQTQFLPAGGAHSGARTNASMRAQHARGVDGLTLSRHAAAEPPRAHRYPLRQWSRRAGAPGVQMTPHRAGGPVARTHAREQARRRARAHKFAADLATLVAELPRARSAAAPPPAAPPRGPGSRKLHPACARARALPRFDIASNAARTVFSRELPRKKIRRRRVCGRALRRSIDRARRKKKQKKTVGTWGKDAPKRRNGSGHGASFVRGRPRCASLPCTDIFTTGEFR